MAHSASLGEVAGARCSRGGKAGVPQEHFTSEFYCQCGPCVSAICKGKLHLQHRFLMPSSCLCHNRSVWLMFIHIKALLFYCKSDHAGSVMTI